MDGVRQSTIARLRAAGCVYAEDEADVLLRQTSDAATLEELVSRREQGEPLEYVVGWAQFCGLRIAVEPGVFVPRRRSEALALAAAALARSLGQRPRVVDVCCGSGAIGAVVASATQVDLYATDVDPVAVRCARRNLAAATVLHGDLFEPLPPQLRGWLDLVVSNAPYVPTGEIPFLPTEARLYEQPAALDGGPDGLDVHRRIAAAATEWLKPGGYLLIEVADSQEASATNLLEGCGLTPVGVPSVIAGHDTGASYICAMSTKRL